MGKRKSESRYRKPKSKSHPRHSHGKMKLDTKSPMFSGIIRGMLPWFVLTRLKDGPLHGTEIIRSMSEKSGHTYKPSPGSVYPILKRFEDDAIITGDWKRGKAAPKRIYKLTRKGRTAFPKIRQKLIDELKLANHMLQMHIVVLEKEARAKKR